MMESYRINDIDLSVYEQGQGRVILFVHGFPFDHSLWRRTCDDCVTDYRVMAPDLRGLGRSQLPREWTLTSMECFADDLHELIQLRNIKEKIIICGLSMGGYIAMQYAEKYSNELAGMVLCSTKTLADSPEAAENRRKQAAGLNAGTLTLSAIADVMIPKLFSVTTLQHQPETVTELRSMIENNNPLGVAAATLGMAERPDTTEWLSQLEIPVLVIGGSEDQFSPPSDMRQIAQQTKYGTFAEIPNAGHLPPLEQSRTFAEILRNFLKQQIR
jgi:pimeloyl-ACP methyl ester carboxylesterase